MEDPFESPKFLVAQTLESVAEFHAIRQHLFEPPCYQKVVQVDPKTGNKTYKLKITKPIPKRARHIAATGISDLKHALDQAFCAAVELDCGSDPGTMYFPFATSPADLEGRFNSKAYAMVSENIRAIVRGFTPYPSGAGHEGGNDLLCGLSKAAGPNKHRFTCRVHGRITRFSIDNFHVYKGVGSVSIPPKWDADRNEIVFATVAPDGNFEFTGGLEFYIGFHEAGPLTQMQVEECLMRLCYDVEQIISQLEAASKRASSAP